MAEPSSSAAASSAAAASAGPAAVAGGGSSADGIALAARNKAADGGDPGFSRLNIPFIMDKVDVTDPELIRMVSTHPDVDRLHAVATKDKPWWMKLYLSATRFTDRDDEWFVPLTSDKHPMYAKRIAYIEESLKDGFHEEDVKKIAYLMHTKAPEEELERTVTNALNRRFFDKDIPNEIIESAGKTSNSFLGTLTSLYFIPRYHRAKVLDFIEENPQKLGGCPFADFSHHLGAGVQVLTPACHYLHDEKDRSRTVADIFTQGDSPLTEQAPRICIKDTTLGGLLDKPAKAGKTMFILKIRQAAAQTKDFRFSFGSGIDQRQCALKPAFEQLMADLQIELVRLEEAEKVAAATDDGSATNEN